MEARTPSAGTCEVATKLEAGILGISLSRLPPPPRETRELNTSVPPMLNTTTLRCSAHLHTATHLLALNMPLFISIDAHSPRTNAALLLFVQTFPCIFFLSDFSSHLEPLRTLVNAEDGLRLEDFLLPLVYSIVAAKSAQVVVRRAARSVVMLSMCCGGYHGLPIVQRG